MTKTYRQGAVGALMDEYERAAAELKNIIEKTSEADYLKICDDRTDDEDCRSIQTIMSHVVRACYGYANYMRQAFGMDSNVSQPAPTEKNEVLDRLDSAMKYTAETLEGRWQMPDEEINATTIHTRWGVTYDLEQMLEHAIVHILRHRRQIEKFLAGKSAA
jgi:uncharacterized damage-inducible protein DinB